MKVFNRDLNELRDEADFTWSGSLFQRNGAAEKNDLWPHEVNVRGWMNRDFVRERRLRFGLYGTRRSLMYDGEEPDIERYT